MGNAIFKELNFCTRTNGGNFEQGKIRQEEKLLLSNLRNFPYNIRQERWRPLHF
jgi:hypothetical protein